MEIKKIAVIGAGTMGSGITTVAVLSGFEVVFIDISEEVLNKARGIVDKNLTYNVTKGKITEADKTKALQAITFSTALKDAGGADLVIEAVSENMEIKKKVFAQISQTVSADTIVCSNTSALKISDLAMLCKHPDKVMGMHFFNPVPVMKLVELIKTDFTSQETFTITKQFVVKLGKEAVVVKESCGFIVNRVLIPMINEAAMIFSEGIASAADIDKAMQLGANHPIGPLALADLIGLDICLSIMQTLQKGLNAEKYKPAPILQELVQAGKLGKKTKSGFYNY
jgi:3-hydroxybutyryl-CoA dehydrogenase